MTEGSPMNGGAHVVVVGGGLAGITAAIALAETGHRVTLLEARPRLGGATTSFSRGGLMIDNGQHVFLRCCSAYRGLLARLGTTGSVSLQDRFDVTVLSPGGRATLRRTGLPGPLHMGRALTGYDHLSLAERLRVIPAALALARLDPGDPDLDGRRLGDWLAEHGQGERARRALWDLFTVSSLNIAGDDANLALAATVVKTALLGAKDAADIGVPLVPLGDLHGRAAADLLGRLGARVRLSAKAAAVGVLPSGGFAVRLAERGGTASNGNGASPAGSGNGASNIGDGRAAAGGGRVAAEPSPGVGGEEPLPGVGGGESGDVIRADGVVLAVPPDVATRLAPQGPSRNGSGQWGWQGGGGAIARGGGWRSGDLGSSPIVNVHVIYDRRVTRLPFAAAVDSPVQWVFDRTGPSGLQKGQYLAVSLSAAERYVDVPAARLQEGFLHALADLFPGAAQAQVVDCFVTRERRATFRQEPGCERLRPPAATGVPGLVLAGAWTDTGWPDTMEGAVRSGLNAARELRRSMPGLSARQPVATGAPA